MRVKPGVVTAKRWVGRLRGGAMAHLIEGDDGYYYAVKFSNNPQGRRILVNEFISSMLLPRFGVLTPVVAFVQLEAETLDKYSEMFMDLGAGGRVAVPPGMHFGSRYPCTPGDWPIYDFLPDALLPRVYNGDHFLGALVFDKWVSNADSRQAVFFQARVLEEMERTGGAGLRWVAQMIDHGHAFQGCDWTLRDSPIQGLYGRLRVYGSNPTMRDFEPWIDAPMSITPDTLKDAFAQLPPAWIRGEERELLRLLHLLDARRERVPSLIRDSLLYLQGRSREKAKVRVARTQGREMMSAKRVQFAIPW